MDDHAEKTRKKSLSTREKGSRTLRIWVKSFTKEDLMIVISLLKLLATIVGLYV